MPQRGGSSELLAGACPASAMRKLGRSRSMDHRLLPTRSHRWQHLVCRPCTVGEAAPCTKRFATHLMTKPHPAMAASAGRPAARCPVACEVCPTLLMHMMVGTNWASSAAWRRMMQCCSAWQHVASDGNLKHGGTAVRGRKVAHEPQECSACKARRGRTDLRPLTACRALSVTTSCRSSVRNGPCEASASARGQGRTETVGDLQAQVGSLQAALLSPKHAPRKHKLSSGPPVSSSCSSKRPTLVLGSAMALRGAQKYRCAGYSNNTYHQMWTNKHKATHVKLKL